jgi:hypothetical protein
MLSGYLDYKKLVAFSGLLALFLLAEKADELMKNLNLHAKMSIHVLY